MTDTPTGPADEIGAPDADELAELERLIDIEVAKSEWELQALVRPDPMLEAYLGPDAEPKALDDFGDDLFDEGDDDDGAEWHGPPDLWRDEVAGGLDQHESRITAMEHSDEEPTLLPENPWRWAKLNAAWTPGSNTVTAHPCADDLGTGEDTDKALTLYCTQPKDGTPDSVNLADDDVVAYLRFYDKDHSEYRGVIIALGGAAGICWGKATGAWASGNTATLDPCTSAGVDNGLANVTGYLISPTGDTPAARGLEYDIAEDDVLAYIPYGTSKGVIVNAHLRLLAGVAQYRVLSWDGSKWISDWVRAH